MARRKKLRIDECLDEIRGVLARYADIPEAELYEELLGEAEGWKMRLEELEDEAETGGK